MIYFTRVTFPVLVVLGFIFGSYMFLCWLHEAVVSAAPVVTGTVIDRKEVQSMGKGWGDFTILITDPYAIVHAETQPYLLNEIPDQVRFRYNGDPAREVFLFEYEENPLYIALFCYACALFLSYLIYYEKKHGISVLSLSRPLNFDFENQSNR
ncbi:hypothetical protein F1728_09910 [Gimesia benthica]|uniref:DUF3592 domain-containing protein n=1 Tax=Gimesia benthica TaxID=2608982 RepID=A0A6I6ADC8_9PLAN|nr:hypothetical protein [Gimesia benthica]QGQ22969.1 hypothetical protein F1728_09910 [Gimesia benthica]